MTRGVADVGVSIAVRAAPQLLGSDLVAGVNLSGIAMGAGPQERSRIMSAIAAQLNDHSGNR